MYPFRSRSIATRLTAALAVSLILVSCLAGAVNYFMTVQKGQQELEAKADEYVDVLKRILIRPLWNYDNETIRLTGDTFTNNELVTLLEIEDSEGHPIFNLKKPDGAPVIMRRVNVMYNNELAGKIKLGLTVRPYQKSINSLLISSLLLIALVLLVIFLISGLLLRVFLKKPLQQLTDIASSYGLGEYGAGKKDTPCAEFQPVVKVMRHMGDKIQAQMDEQREAERRYRSIVENSLNGIFTSSPEGRYLSVNPAYASMLAYANPEEVINNITDIGKQVYADPADRKALIEKLIEEGSVAKFECKIRRKDGRVIWISQDVRCVTEEQGLPLFFEGFVIDISKQKEVEQALRASEQSYRSIYENALEAMYRSSIAGRFITVNPAMARMCGYESPSEMIQTITDISTQYYVNPEDRRQNLRFIDAKGIIEKKEFKVKRKDGSEIWVSNSARAIRNDRGEIAFYEGMMIEITERKLAEKEIRRNEAFLRGFFRAVPAGLAMLKDRVFLRVNEQFGVMTGYSTDELTNMEARTLYFNETEYLKAGREFYEQIGERGFGSCETRWRRKDGRAIDVLMNGAPSSPDAAPTEIVAAVFDVTEKKEQERLYHLLFEKANDAILLMQGLEIIHCNSKAVEMYGAPREEIIGRTPLDFTDPKLSDGTNSLISARGRIEKALKGEPQSFEWRHRRPDGTSFNAEINLSKVDMRGRDYIQAIVRDVTKRKQVEEALRKSEDYLASIFRTVPTGVAVHKGRIFIMVNERITEILGYSKEELLGHTSRILYFNEQEYLETGRKFTEQIQERGLGSNEVRLRHKSGREIQVLITSAALQRVQDEPIFIHCLLDITESVKIRKELERYKEQLEELVEQRTKALQESEERYRSILESMEEGYYEVDLTGNMTFINDSFCRMWGYSREELIGVNNRAYSSPEEAKRVFKIYSRIYQTEHPESVLDFEVIRKDGQKMTVEVSASLRRDQLGRPIGFWGVVRDITERKRFEQELKDAKEAAEAANQAKSEFLANMSHEIRTPMNAVVGMSELLLTTALTRKQKYYAGSISDAAGALLTILDDILDLSKIQAGKLNLENVSFDLREVVEQVGQMLAVRAQGKDIEVLVRYPINLPSQYIGDPTRIRQVLLNLAGNAVKFTETGHVLLEVSLKGKEKDQCELHLSVSDTGIGISPEYLEIIFQKFSQADESTTRKYGGTGLGLPISKKLVEMMGGSIGAKSTLGQGSVFWFDLTLPCSDEPDLPFLRDMELTDMRVLVVDDNERNREIALEYLQLRSVPSDAVESATKALECLRRAKNDGCPFTMAILDHHMPGMDGGELALTIKNDPEIKKTVLILLSSFMPLDELPPETRACFAGGINKPIKVSLFFETLLEAWNTYLSREPKRATPPPTPLPSFQPLDFEAKVLLVEDSRMNRQVATEILKRFGCRIDVAGNGLEAVQQFEANVYDLIFMDIHMPIMDGFEAARTIREKEKSQNPTPIVAMTALAMQGDREKCLEAGMNDYIAKPIRSAVVRDILVKTLSPRKKKTEENPPDISETRPEGDMVLNPQYLIDISGRDPEIIEALINQFKRDAPIYLDELKAAVLGEDQDLIYKMSHRLQGLAANAGGEKVRARLIDIESRIRQGKHIPDIVNITPLEVELKQLVKELVEMDWPSLCEKQAI